MAVVLVLAAVCLGGFFVWQNYGRLTDPTAGGQPAVQSQAPPRAQASDETKQVLNALEQTVKDLQASQQQTADQLSEIKRDLAAEQGERKMLSEQIGALAGRVDSLAAAPSSSVAPGATGNASAKKKR
jgi:chromosome segregation ATPase